MKKVLFASTALVAFTGAAAADVTLSGRAEMGIFGSTVAETQFFTDIDVTFTLTGETDNGLTFGASIDIDEGGDQSAVNDNSDDGGIAIFVRGDFGNVTLGDTDGALDWALVDAGNVGNPGSIADDETSHSGYLGGFLDAAGGNDGQILRYDFSAGDFGVAVSLETDETGGDSGSDFGYGVGVRYNLNLGGTTIALGLGYQDVGEQDIDAIGFSASTTLDNGLSLGITYTDFSGDDAAFDDHIGLGIGYTTGAITLHANYGEFSGADGADDQDGFGLAAAYDLGGGAVAHFGYGDGEDFTSASIGLGLSF